MIVKIIKEIMRLFDQSKGQVQGVNKKVAELGTEIDQVREYSDKHDSQLRKVDSGLKRQIVSNDEDIKNIRSHLKSVENKVIEESAQNDTRIKQVQKKFESVIDLTELNADDIKDSIELMKKLDKENDGMLSQLNKEFNAHEKDIADAYTLIKNFKM